MFQPLLSTSFSDSGIFLPKTMKKMKEITIAATPIQVAMSIGRLSPILAWQMNVTTMTVMNIAGRVVIQWKRPLL